MELLKELLTTYWSQLTLLLVGIGYFIKRILDTISNKREINHNLFQQYRIKAVSDFFSSYAKTERMWKDLSIFPILEYKLDTKEMDKIIFEPVNELRKNVLELQIYFCEKDHKFFVDILDNALAINGKLNSVYFDYGNEISVIAKSNDFSAFRDEKLDENKEIFKHLSQKIKETFY